MALPHVGPWTWQSLADYCGCDLPRLRQLYLEWLKTRPRLDLTKIDDFIEFATFARLDNKMNKTLFKLVRVE